MALTLYNTLTRRKEPFETLEPGKVRMYCCGVTVYDYCHLGHARSYIVWDIVRRYLQWRGYHVHYVQNFTDIDDKILNRAKAEGSTMEAVSDRFIAAYFEDMARLNIGKADAYPRATHTLNGIRRLIHDLEQKGMAYAAAGDVYYAVRKFPTYGKLSGRKLDDLQAGASGRVDDPEAPKKQDPFDFALWKAAKPGEPSWESPWGEGRPGWHIECSAMVQDAFASANPTPAGAEIDIHVGGADLIFPHHENEIAQSEAASGKALSRYWMHNGMVNVDGEKMSKSLGNFTTIRQLLDEPLEVLEGHTFDPMALRLFVLQAHYRKPIDFAGAAIAAAQNSWHTLQEGLRFGYDYGSSVVGESLPPLSSQGESVQRFQAAMDDDFNTPGALAVLFELAKDLRRAGHLIDHQGQADRLTADLLHDWQTLVTLAQVLGLETQPTQPSAQPEGIAAEDIETLIQARQQARKAKNFAESDRLRDQLKAQGIALIDQPDGTTRWIRESSG
ncbi:MAG: cysteine--tRNA ligase [Thermosynechococcaceae cyanobacterium]